MCHYVVEVKSGREVWEHRCAVAANVGVEMDSKVVPDARCTGAHLYRTFGPATESPDNCVHSADAPQKITAKTAEIAPGAISR